VAGVARRPGDREGAGEVASIAMGRDEAATLAQWIAIWVNGAYPLDAAALRELRVGNVPGSAKERRLLDAGCSIVLTGI